MEHLLLQRHTAIQHLAAVIVDLRHSVESADVTPDAEAPDTDDTADTDDKATGDKANDNAHDEEVLDFAPGALLVTGALPGLPPRVVWEHTEFPPPAPDDF